MKKKRTYAEKDFLTYTEKQRTPSILYFAFGSNLSLKQMKQRCPDAVPVAAFSLPGYSLVFRSVADVTPQLGGEAHGAIYHISERDRDRLDRYEGCYGSTNGVSHGRYRREYFRIHKQTGLFSEETGRATAPVLFYAMNRDEDISGPSPEYFGRILRGYADWHLETESLYTAKTSADEAVRDRYRHSYSRYSEPTGYYRRSISDDREWGGRYRATQRELDEEMEAIAALEAEAAFADEYEPDTDDVDDVMDEYAGFCSSCGGTVDDLLFCRVCGKNMQDELLADAFADARRSLDEMEADAGQRYGDVYGREPIRGEEF